MHKILPIFILSVCGLSFAPLLWVVPSIAHQHQLANSRGVGGTIHVDPNDSPVVGRESQAWFVLTRADGSPIPLADCNCRVMVHDAQDEAIAHHLPLTAISVAGQTAIGTTITFPAPGSYRVILVGESEDSSFEPFELIFPITAVNS